MSTALLLDQLRAELLPLDGRPCPLCHSVDPRPIEPNAPMLPAPDASAEVWRDYWRHVALWERARADSAQAIFVSLLRERGMEP